LKKSILIHLICWSLYVGWLLYKMYTGNSHGVHWMGAIFTYLLFAAVFYAYALFILPSYLVKKEYLLFFIVNISCWMIYLAIDYLIEGIYEVAVYGNEPFIPDFKGFVEPLTWYYVQYALYGVGYFYARQSIQKEQLLRLAEKENHLLEVSFLRAQMNPHFLFNTLGFFYNSVKEDKPAVAEGMLTLSDIMRYALLKTNPMQQALLADEWAYLQKYLQLVTLRYGNTSAIQIQAGGDMGNIYIVPQTLLTPVENAIKHGIINNPAAPLQISLQVAEQQITYRVHNQKRNRPVPDTHCLGIVNMQKQLQRVYGNRFLWTVTDKDDFYTTLIQIPILPYTPASNPLFTNPAISPS
jgi:two-component system, LytTR family, sensor kinase